MLCGFPLLSIDQGALASLSNQMLMILLKAWSEKVFCWGGRQSSSPNSQSKQGSSTVMTQHARSFPVLLIEKRAFASLSKQQPTILLTSMV